MARAKQLRPVDHLTQSLLADAVRETGAKHADVGEKAGMSQNRVSIILRLGTPPATVGEISAIARAIGRSGSEFIAAAEAEVASAVARSSSDRTGSVAPSLRSSNGARDGGGSDVAVSDGAQVLSLRPDVPPPRRSIRLRPALWVTALSGRWRRLAVSAKRMCSPKATNLRVTI